jgi:hypothetical protein
MTEATPLQNRALVTFESVDFCALAPCVEAPPHALSVTAATVTPASRAQRLRRDNPFGMAPLLDVAVTHSAARPEIMSLIVLDQLLKRCATGRANGTPK